MTETLIEFTDTQAKDHRVTKEELSSGKTRLQWEYSPPNRDSWELVWEATTEDELTDQSYSPIGY